MAIQKSGVQDKNNSKESQTKKSSLHEDYVDIEHKMLDALSIFEESVQPTKNGDTLSNSTGSIEKFYSENTCMPAKNKQSEPNFPVSQDFTKFQNKDFRKLDVLR